MLKPVEMTKVRILVSDEYSEEVIRAVGEEGIMELEPLESDLCKCPCPCPLTSEELKDASYLEKRVTLILDILGVEERRDAFGSLIPPERTPIEKENTKKHMEDVEDLLDDVEGQAIEISEKIEKLEVRKSALLDRRKILVKHRENLEILTELGGRIEWLGDSHALHLAFGSLPEEASETLIFLEEGLKKNFLLWRGVEREGRVPIMILTLLEGKETLKGILERLGWRSYELPPPGTEEELDRITGDIEAIDKDLKGLRRELEDMRDKYGEKLLVSREIVENGKNVLELKSKSFNTENVILLSGWIPAKKLNELEACLKKNAKGDFLLKTYSAGRRKNIPTFLENPSIFKPFESLTSTFGLPGYREMDPTVFLAITFPLFYGMMFGDVGHGALVALLGVVLSRLGKRSEGIRNLGIIILICGIFSIAFGFLYGDVFGMGPHEQEKILGTVIIKHLDLEGLHLGSIEKISPIEDPPGFLNLAIYVAIFHISLGLFIDIWNKISERKFLQAFTSPVVKLWLYYGALYLLMTYQMDFGLWAENLLLVVVLTLLPLILILFSELIKHIREFNPKQIPTFLGEGGFEVFDTILLFLSNTISYSRLFALALVHAGLFMALFSISEMVIGIPVIGSIVWFLLVAIGTVVILALEAIIVFLHSLRLHYYEWFSKFFGADGIPFKPFKTKRVYTYVKE